MLTHLKCIITGHYYLPQYEVIAFSNGEETRTEFLQCSRCGDVFRYPYGEYWHTNRHITMHEDAHARLEKESHELP